MSEWRSYRLSAPEVRSDGDAGPVLVGYAAVFDRYSQNLGGFVEVIEHGAFSDALGRADHVAGLFNHDANLLLGTVDSGSLLLEQDDVGLRYEIPLDLEDPDGLRVHAKARSGKLSGSSFSFTVKEDGVEWGLTEQGFPLRRIRSGGVQTLYDVGPVTFPAYTVTRDEELAVALRSIRADVPVSDLVSAARANTLKDVLVSDADGDDTGEVESEHLRPVSVRRWTASRGAR